jgi:DNA-binding PadR family transcriptional regulator
VKANKTSGDISRNRTFDCELMPALIELESLGIITISYLKHRVFGIRKIIKSSIATLTDAGVVIVKYLLNKKDTKMKFDEELFGQEQWDAKEEYFKLLNDEHDKDMALPIDMALFLENN